jgi:hypothetical protein
VSTLVTAPAVNNQQIAATKITGRITLAGSDDPDLVCNRALVSRQTMSREVAKTAARGSSGEGVHAFAPSSFRLACVPTGPLRRAFLLESVREANVFIWRTAQDLLEAASTLGNAGRAR